MRTTLLCDGSLHMSDLYGLLYVVKEHGDGTNWKHVLNIRGMGLTKSLTKGDIETSLETVSALSVSGDQTVLNSSLFHLFWDTTDYMVSLSLNGDCKVNLLKELSVIFLPLSHTYFSVEVLALLLKGASVKTVTVFARSLLVSYIQYLQEPHRRTLHRIAGKLLPDIFTKQLLDLIQLYSDEEHPLYLLGLSGGPIDVG